MITAEEMTADPSDVCFVYMGKLLCRNLVCILEERGEPH